MQALPFMANYTRPDVNSNYTVVGGFFGNIFLTIMNDLNAT